MMTEEEPPSYYSLINKTTQYTEIIPPGPSAPLTEAPCTSGAASTHRTLSVSFRPVFEHEIKNACHTYATEHCCYGSSFIDNMIVTEITDRIAYKYTLESFGEKRATSTQTRPYHGGYVDGRENGVSPRPWDITVTPLRFFKDHSKSVEIPNTVFSTPCLNCEGKGTTTCIWCFGVGGKGCLMCMFDENKRPCSYCRFSNRRCIFCDGRGKNPCKKCVGLGKLRGCGMLNVTWINHKEHFVSDTMGLPAELIVEEEGKLLFTEERDKFQLLPVCNCDDVSVNVASTDMIARHRTSFKNELVIKQRQKLVAVPYTQVKYQWKDHIGEFFIYGLGKKVYFDNYPQQCCCCCIM